MLRSETAPLNLSTYHTSKLEIPYGLVAITVLLAFRSLINHIHEISRSIERASAYVAEVILLLEEVKLEPDKALSQGDVEYVVLLLMSSLRECVGFGWI